jgi:CPA2 family monovalent cation:H+ antiporter-2
LLAEISVTRSAGGENTDALRSVVSNTILAAGSVLLVLVILLMSSTILPSWRLLLVQALIVAATAILLQRAFTRMYSKAQFALLQTLSEPPVPPSAGEMKLPAILRDAQIATIRIHQSAPASGKMIGELALRTRTGASVVGIQRNGESIINPGPDEEIRANDEVLLLGSQAHLESARMLLAQEQGSTPSAKVAPF